MTDANVLKLPPDFPEVEVEEIVRLAGVLDAKYRAKSGGQPCDEWRGFIASYHGLRVRFRAMAEAEEVYVTTVPQSNETRENVYLQDSALFAFFTNAVSVLEVFCYACFSLASQMKPSAFPMKTEIDCRRITPRFVLERFQLFYPKEVLTKALADLLDDADFTGLHEARNILSHRGNPPRAYGATIEIIPGRPPQHKFIGGAKGDPPIWHGMVLDANALAERRTWIAGCLQTLVSAALEFARTNIR
jgi:hypothetical protein